MMGHSKEVLNILTIFTTPSKSHYLFIKSLIVALANRGHYVTFISPERENQAIHRNIQTIWIENIYDGMPGSVNLEEPPNRHGTLEEIMKIYDFGVMICERAMKSQGVQTLLDSNDSFDLIVMDMAGSQAFYGFVKHFGKPPVVGFSAFGNPPWVCDVVGGGSEPWQIPHASMTCSNKMNYLERCRNEFLYCFTRLYRRHSVMPRMYKIMNKYFVQPDEPSKIEQDFQIILVNANSVTDFPQSWPPTLIPIAGLHLQPSDSDDIDLDLRLFMENSTKGFVYLSLGEMIDINQMKPTKLQSLLTALSMLEENVVWHLPRGNLPYIPNNLLIRKEVTQNYILGHRNIRVFFTPCGGLSLQEAVYHGVPLLCLPFSSNDIYNSRKSVTLGIGITLNYSRLTHQQILTNLRRIINDPSFSCTAKILSRQFNDQPITPLQRAIFFVEYAARNRETSHLRLPAVDMNWFQISMTDVRLGYLFVILLPLIAIIFLFKTIL